MLPGKSSARALHPTFLEEGIRITRDGGAPVRFPLGANDPKLLSELMRDGSAWAALEELWEEGLLASTGVNSWTVPYDVFERFVGEDREALVALGLPLPDPSLPIRVESRGSVADEHFRARIEINHPELGTIREGEAPRTGPAFILSREAILPLTTEQRLLFDTARDTDVDRSNIEERMGYMARVKAAAQNAGATLDPYFAAEDYRFIDTAGIDVREDSPDELTLVPAIEGIEEFSPSGGEILLGDRPPAVLTKPGAGRKRQRMVFGSELRGRLKGLPRKGKVEGADVPRLLTNPDQILPEGFDLTLFSERVKGLRTRVYNSRPYIHVQRSKGGWFEGVPGIEVEDWSPGDVPGEGPGSGPPPGISPETYRSLVERARETGKEYVRHGDGWIRVDPEEASRFDKALDGLEPAEDRSLRIPAGSVLDIYENLELLEFVDRRSVESAGGGLLPDDLPAEEVPSGLKGELFPHQLQGYRWLARLESRLTGGLLADDMGLGKTVQVIAHVLRQKEKGNPVPHLVVVPKTLIENWTREIRRFSDGALRVYPYDGPERRFGEGFFSSFDVVLTTYDTLRRDQARLGTIDWNLVACDEAQYAKNPTAQRTSAVKALKSRHRAALTGTPVENGLIEFWCIMDFVQPGLLGSWSEFRTKYERPIVEGDDAERERRVQELLEELRGYYLRRMKDEILRDLPPKEVHYRTAGFGKEQFELYRAVAREGKSGGKGAALAAITRLIQLTAHPGAVARSLLDQGTTPEDLCPKLEETLRVLEEVRGQSEKAIIFTDFKAVQRILQDTIRRRFGIWPDIINGELTQNRQAVIDIFSEKPGFNAIILGHQVAGVGLNITAANHVIHYTRPWNPAKENQATDRCHRIGQTKPVRVYYPMVKDERFVTVEERLDDVIHSKADLARDVLRPSSELAVRGEDLLECLNEVA